MTQFAPTFSNSCRAAVGLRDRTRETVGQIGISNSHERGRCDRALTGEARTGSNRPAALYRLKESRDGIFSASFDSAIVVNGPKFQNIQSYAPSR